MAGSLRSVLFVTALATTWLAPPVALTTTSADARIAPGSRLFEDDFESGLGNWNMHGRGGVVVRDSGDPTHGRVLVPVPNGDVYALIEESEHFGAHGSKGTCCSRMRPTTTSASSYFGRRGRRTDFGVIYIKGNDSYLQANPHRTSTSRTLYPEFRAMLIGDAAIRARRWQNLRSKSSDGRAFLRRRDAGPQLTFAEFERQTGALGCSRVLVGGDVWVDNIRVTSIDRFSYSGRNVPT
jgi:hypothetical protein